MNGIQGLFRQLMGSLQLISSLNLRTYGIHLYVMMNIVMSML